MKSIKKCIECGSTVSKMEGFWSKFPDGSHVCSTECSLSYSKKWTAQIEKEIQAKLAEHKEFLRKQAA